MIDPGTLYSLGWTLIHSFWQLTVLVVIFYLLLIIFRHRQPAQRYILSLGFMAVSVSVTSLTFIFMYSKYALSVAGSAPGNPAIINLMASGETTASGGFWPSIVTYLESNVASLTYMYMIGLGLLFMRMIISYRRLNLLKSGSAKIADGQLRFLPDLTKKMNVRMKISIRSSKKVNMPMVIGALQPVILIPASVLTNTAPHILKAIIAHELAHIRRHDFLINIFQSVIETLFFYHPAMWYFSYIARREREFCCDQQAINGGCPPEDLARALSEVGYLQRNGEWAISLGGSSNDLLNRIKLLLGYKPALHYVPTQSVWYYGSLLGFFLLFSIGKSNLASTHPADIKNPLSTVWLDTLPEAYNIEMESDVSVRNRKVNIIDTLIEYRYNENGINPTDLPEIIMNTDTTVRIIRTDTIPGEKKMVIIQTDGKVITIVNGDTVSVSRFAAVPGQPELRKWQDSLRMVQRKMLKKYRNQELDSLMALHRHNLGEQRKTMRIQEKYLDSLHKHLPEIQSRIRSYQFSMSDSIPGITLAIPSMPPMPPMPPAPPMPPSPSAPPMPPMPSTPPMPPMPYMDSIFSRNVDLDLNSLFSDSTFTIGSNVNFHIYSDSLFSSAHPPFTRAYGFSHIGPKSKELKELDKKIREKEKELRDLQRQKWEKYREEYRKKKEESK